MTPQERHPAWTVCYNIVSEENDRFVGTGWEFFDNKRDADSCYERQCKNGNCPTKRPFYLSQDGQHLGAIHSKIRSLAKNKAIAAAVAGEQEACAQVAESFRIGGNRPVRQRSMHALDIAAAIRARQGGQ